MECGKFIMLNVIAFLRAGAWSHSRITHSHGYLWPVIANWFDNHDNTYDFDKPFPLKLTV